jgi:hypothetical protein
MSRIVVFVPVLFSIGCSAARFSEADTNELQLAMLAGTGQVATTAVGFAYEAYVDAGASFQACPSVVASGNDPVEWATYEATTDCTGIESGITWSGAFTVENLDETEDAPRRYTFDEFAATNSEGQCRFDGSMESVLSPYSQDVGIAMRMATDDGEVSTDMELACDSAEDSYTCGGQGTGEVVGLGRFDISLNLVQGPDQSIYTFTLVGADTLEIDLMDAVQVQGQPCYATTLDGVPSIPFCPDTF